MFSSSFWQVMRYVLLYSLNLLGSGLLEVGITERALATGSTGAVTAGLIAVAVTKIAGAFPRSLSWLIAGPLVDLLPSRWVVVIGSSLLIGGDLWLSRTASVPLTAWAFISTVAPVVVLALDSAYSRVLTATFTNRAVIDRIDANKHALIVGTQVLICMIWLVWPGLRLDAVALFDAFTYLFVIGGAVALLPAHAVTRQDVRSLVRSYGTDYLVSLRWVAQRRRLIPLLQSYSLWGLAELLRPVVVTAYLPGRGAAVATLISRLGGLTASMLSSVLIRTSRPRMAATLGRLGLVGLSVGTVVLALGAQKLGSVWTAGLILYGYAVFGEWPWLWLNQMIFHDASIEMRGRAKAAMQAYAFGTIAVVSTAATSVPIVVLASIFGATGVTLALFGRRTERP